MRGAPFEPAALIHETFEESKDLLSNFEMSACGISHVPRKSMEDMRYGGYSVGRKKHELAHQHRILRDNVAIRCGIKRELSKILTGFEWQLTRITGLITC